MDPEKSWDKVNYKEIQSKLYKSITHIVQFIVIHAVHQSHSFDVTSTEKTSKQCLKRSRIQNYEVDDMGV